MKPVLRARTTGSPIRCKKEADESEVLEVEEAVWEIGLSNGVKRLYESSAAGNTSLENSRAQLCCLFIGNRNQNKGVIASF